MNPTVIEAIRDGDLEAVRRHLDEAPPDAGPEDWARAVGAEVLRHGGPGFAELFYDTAHAPPGVWDGIDPVVWAADHGACQLLAGLVRNRPVPEATLRQALDAARAWLGDDPETELRRRVGAGPDETVTVDRDHVIIHEFAPRAPRLRLTTADGRTGEVLLSHRGAVTVLEATLDRPASRDELLARALWSADPNSQDWSTSDEEMRRRFSIEENVRWAIGRLTDPDVVVRRFAAKLMHSLTSTADQPGKPYAAPAVTALQARFAVEPDGDVMSDLIGAYAGFRECAVLDELLPFAGDPRPEVRLRVASSLMNCAGDQPPHVLGALLDLARDPDPTVRLVATAEIVHESVDTPAVREMLAAHRAGDDRRLQIEAAFGLARRGDADALAHLRRLSDEDGEESHAGYQLDSVERGLGLRPV